MPPTTRTIHVTTGFPESDALAAFARERRRQSLAKLASRLRMKPQDTLVMPRLDNVMAALGRVAERDLGLQSIALESIVGTVDRRSGEFDRQFRPASSRLQTRWQSIAAARRRGQTMPPIDVYRIGELHFVEDGHHRVSVARAHGDTMIDAHVREVQTTVAASQSGLVRTGTCSHRLGRARGRATCSTGGSTRRDHGQRGTEA